MAVSSPEPTGMVSLVITLYLSLGFSSMRVLKGGLPHVIDGGIWYVFQGVPKSTSQHCHLTQTSLRAPLGRTTWQMEALRSFPTRSRMTPPKSWALSLKPPPLLGAPSSPHRTWPRPSATGFNLKTTPPGPAHHHLRRKQVRQVGG